MSPNPPNTSVESESLRTRGAKFDPLVSIHKIEEIRSDKVKVVPNRFREITIPNTTEKKKIIEKSQLY
jgi:hypothetical protein